MVSCTCIIRLVSIPTFAPGVIPPNAVIGGISIDLPYGYNEDAKQTINDATTTIATTDPFGDNSLVSQFREGEEAAVVKRDNDSDEVQIGEQAMTLDDTANSASQDMFGSSAADGNRTWSRPTSPQTINIYQIRDSILTASSNVTGLTVNRDSQNSSGG